MFFAFTFSLLALQHSGIWFLGQFSFDGFEPCLEITIYQRSVEDHEFDVLPFLWVGIVPPYCGHNRLEVVTFGPKLTIQCHLWEICLPLWRCEDGITVPRGHVGAIPKAAHTVKFLTH